VATYSSSSAFVMYVGMRTTTLPPTIDADTVLRRLAERITSISRGGSAVTSTTASPSMSSSSVDHNVSTSVRVVTPCDAAGPPGIRSGSGS
jgi:hypothetical protein